MNDQQTEIIQTVQEVLRALTTSLLALNPAAIPMVSKALSAHAHAHGISPMAQTMLADLAAGVALIERAGKKGE